MTTLKGHRRVCTSYPFEKLNLKAKIKVFDF